MDKNWFPARQRSAAILTPLKLCWLCFGLACALKAGTLTTQQSDSAPNRIGDITISTNGTLVRFAGIPDFTYTIERSSDGTNWSTVASVVSPANGMIELLDTNSVAATSSYRTAAH